MEIAKPTEADKEQFRSLLAGLPGVEIKPMFGNLGAFVNGNMSVGGAGAGPRCNAATQGAQDPQAEKGLTTAAVRPSAAPLCPGTFGPRVVPFSP